MFVSVYCTNFWADVGGGNTSYTAVAPRTAEAAVTRTDTLQSTVVGFYLLYLEEYLVYRVPKGMSRAYPNKVRSWAGLPGPYHAGEPRGPEGWEREGSDVTPRRGRGWEYRTRNGYLGYPSPRSPISPISQLTYSTMSITGAVAPQRSRNKFPAVEWSCWACTWREGVFPGF